jgi:hypothetical protein
MASCPPIDWLGFFSHLDGFHQREFENQLVARDISLGEYMELFEQAAMDACARNLRTHAERIEPDELLLTASRMFTRYVSAKRVLVLHSRRESTARGLHGLPYTELEAREHPDEDANASVRLRELRFAIHDRIEKIKSGLSSP